MKLWRLRVRDSIGTSLRAPGGVQRGLPRRELFPPALPAWDPPATSSSEREPTTGVHPPRSRSPRRSESLRSADAPGNFPALSEAQSPTLGRPLYPLCELALAYTLPLGPILT